LAGQTTSFSSTRHIGALVPPAEAREKLQIINRSGEHRLDVINAVLEMCKLEARQSAV
jgi:signal transduction histidine kinase